MKRNGDLTRKEKIALARLTGHAATMPGPLAFRSTPYVVAMAGLVIAANVLVAGAFLWGGAFLTCLLGGPH